MYAKIYSKINEIIKFSETYIHSVQRKKHLISNEETQFIKQGQSYQKNCRVKRAIVVGNPMFSATIDDVINGEESLSLDDLDMDYEQIMHYFDNLKVRFEYDLKRMK